MLEVATRQETLQQSRARLEGEIADLVAKFERDYRHIPVRVSGINHTDWLKQKIHITVELAGEDD